MNNLIGKTVKDKITGFEGVAIGRVEYITGCNQVLVAPKVGSDGSLRASEWFDEQRLDVTDDSILALENGSTPGCARSAPRI
jgi:hypothetical protein